MQFLNRNWRGLMVFGLGAATLLAAIFLLHNCADTGHLVKLANGTETDMACTWTKRAVEGIGGLVAIMGLVMLWIKESARAISLVAAAAGLLMVATPLWLIPTCKNAMMTCNLSLKPGTLILGGVIALAGLVGALRFARAGAGGVRLSA
jgi:hypothetical protein